jgi:CheY-like chemotaxis protein
MIATNTQTDFYLVIWNDSSYQWFCQQLKAYLLSLQKVTCPAVILWVRSKNEFDTIDWTKNYETVFVLAEAFATNLSFEGLSLIPIIMKERGNEQVLKIMTCSYFGRKELKKISKDWDKAQIVNTTQHLTLPTPPSVFIEFSVIEKLVVSHSKWYAQYYELTNDFYKISRIKHRLDNQRSSGENSFDDGDIGEELNNLLTFSFIKETGNPVLLWIQELKTAIESNQPYHLKDKILVSLIYALQRQIIALAPNGRSVADKYAANILIVDDKPATARQIKAYFLHYFKETDNCKIQILTSGEAALSTIKNNDKQFDAVIADLELLNSEESEDYVQGSDIIDYCQSAYPHIAFRVITHLSPSAAAKRLPNFGGNRIVRKSNNLASEAEDPLWLYDENDFFEKLWLDIDRGRKSRVEQPGPSGGKWGPKSGGSPNLKAHYYDLKSNKSSLFNELMKEVKERALHFLKDPTPKNVKTMLGSPKNNELNEWKQHFANALVLRLIFLNTDKDSEGYVEYANFTLENDGKGLYFDLGFTLSKTFDEEGREKIGINKNRKNPFLNELLGFAVKWKISESGWVIRFKIDSFQNSLFLHETEFQASYQVSSSTTIINKWPKLLCDSLTEQVQYLKTEIVGEDYTALSKAATNFLKNATFANLEKMLACVPHQVGTAPRLKKIEKTILETIEDYNDGYLYMPEIFQKLIDDM